MGESDVYIVAFAVIFASVYGFFLFSYAQESTVEAQKVYIPAENYTAPESAGFFSALDNMWKMSVSNPEIFFVNTTLFLVVGFLLVFVGLRYLRGV